MTGDPAPVRGSSGGDAKGASSCCRPTRPAGATTEVGRRGKSVPVSGASKGDVPALVEVPGGVFTMGTDDLRDYRDDGEGPLHPVQLDAYRMGVCP